MRMRGRQTGHGVGRNVGAFSWLRHLKDSPPSAEPLTDAPSAALSEHPALRDELLSLALARCFRGKLCDTVLRGNSPLTFNKGATLYDVGDERRIFFFIREGVVKIGRVTADGHEIIYDLRKAGDVVGEMCAHALRRRERAVALETTKAIAVSYEKILEGLQNNRTALQQFIESMCGMLSGAYDHVDLLATRDTVSRLVKVLLKLSEEFGRSVGDRVEINTYLTQEDIAQMAAVSREKVSGSLNRLRERSVVQYSRGGHLLLDVNALKTYRE